MSLLVDSYDGECIEGLLTQFQKLFFHKSDANNQTNDMRFTMTKAELCHWGLQCGIHSQDLLCFYSDKYDALEKALQAITMHNKVDYMTAIHVAPELMLHESDPSCFLSFHGL